MSLKRKVLTGVKWVALANIFQQIISLVGLVIFAKLLSPHDFGTFSILMVFIGFLAIFSELGTSAAVIHIKNPSQKLLSSIFYFNLSIGLFLAALLALSSGAIASYFDNPTLAPMLLVVSLNFIIISFEIVPKTLLQKDMNFKYLSLINSMTILTGLVVGLVAAYKGLGAYSLVLQFMVNSVLNVGFIWYFSTWRPSWYFALADIKQIWGYTSHLSVFTIINYFSKNADNFLIGKYLSSSALGVYSLGYRIMLYPLQNISITLMRVLFPAFSSIQDDNIAFKKAYTRVIFFIALITFPIMTGLMATAPLLVDVVFGDKWEGLGLLLVILAPSGLLRSVYATVGTIFMAKGSTDIQLKIGAFNALLTVLGFIIGLQWGIHGVALAYLVVNIIMLYPIFSISWKQIELGFMEGMRVLFPLFSIAAIMGLSIYLLDFTILIHLESKLLRLIALVSIGIGIYLSLIHIKYGGIKKLIGEMRG